MYILDSDTLTHLHAGNPNVVAQIRACADPDVCITIVTEFELLRGRFDYLLKADLLIASIALSQSATLVTRNSRHFRTIPDLRVVNWAD